MIMILSIIAIAGVLGSLIAKALEGFPWLGMIPILNELIPWMASQAGMIIPVSMALFVFTTTRSIIYSLVAFLFALFVMITIGWWSL